MLELLELISGSRFTICVLRRQGRERGLAEMYLDELQKRDRGKLWRLLQKSAEHGPPTKSEQFKTLKGRAQGLCEFKRKPHRLMAFRRGNLYILTHGFQKKDDDTPPEQIDRALRLMREYDGQRQAQP